ncbi:putative membrane protein [Arthrobacter sp. UYCu512]
MAAGLAGTLATLVGQLLGVGHNYWAMVAAVVPLVGHTTRHRVSRGLQRIVGTAIGLVLLAGILLLQPAPWQTVLVIAACQFGAEMFIARHYGLAQIFVTPLALLSTLLVAPSAPGILLRDRIIENRHWSRRRGRRCAGPDGAAPSSTPAAPLAGYCRCPGPDKAPGLRSLSGALCNREASLEEN